MPSPNSLPKGEHELKFHLPRHRTAGLKQWLDIAFVPHPGHAVSMICSIYFDTPQSTSLHEKVQSDFAKTKYRIRWYANEDGEPLPLPAYAEIKEKHGAVRRKYRHLLPVPPSELAAAPLEGEFLPQVFRNHFGDRLPGQVPMLRPALELRYVRRRYQHPCFEESFCLDSDICCIRTRPGFSAPARSQVLPFDVFEQKGHSPQPIPALQALPRFDVRRAAISKYYETLRLLADETSLS